MTNQLPRDANNAPVSGGYDPTTHQPVAFQATAVQTDTSNGVPYGLHQVGMMLYNPATGLWEAQRTPTVFKPLKAQAITAGTAVAVWTPASGKTIRILGYEISAVGAGSSAVIFEDDSGGLNAEFWRTQLVNSSTPLDTPAGFGNGKLLSAADHKLYLDVTVSASITGFIFGCEEG